MVGHRWAWRVAHWHNGAHVAPPGQNVPPTTPPRCHNAEFSHLMPQGSRWSSPLLRSIFLPILCAPEHFFACFKCTARVPRSTFLPILCAPEHCPADQAKFCLPHCGWPALGVDPKFASHTGAPCTKMQHNQACQKYSYFISGTV